MRYTSHCSYDNITVFDGLDASAPLLRTFCGTLLDRVVFSSGNTLFVSFRVHNGYMYDEYNGFKIKYTSIDRTEY